MNTDKILKILAQKAPGLSVAEALAAAQTLADAYIVALGERHAARSTPGERLERTREDERLIKASHWALVALSLDAVTHHKIRSIKVIREEFPGLGLREAKAIVDSLEGRWVTDPNPYPDDEYPEYEYEDEDPTYDPDEREYEPFECYAENCEYCNEG